MYRGFFDGSCGKRSRPKGECNEKKSKNTRKQMLLAALLCWNVAGTGSRPPNRGPEVYFDSREPLGWNYPSAGDYTITLGFIFPPWFAVVRDHDGRSVAIVMSRLPSEKASVEKSALLKEKNGQLCVHSLLLADLRMVLIYDPVLARERVQEAPVSQTVPLMYAKKVGAAFGSHIGRRIRAG
jgi:hypothetical protein